MDEQWAKRYTSFLVRDPPLFNNTIHQYLNMLRNLVAHAGLPTRFINPRGQEVLPHLGRASAGARLAAPGYPAAPEGRVRGPLPVRPTLIRWCCGPTSRPAVRSTTSPSASRKPAPPCILPSAFASWVPEKCARGVCVAPGVGVEMRCACAYISVSEAWRRASQRGLGSRHRMN